MFPLHLLKRAAIALVVITVIVGIGFIIAPSSQQGVGKLTLPQLLADAQAGRISQIEIRSQDARELHITYKDQPNDYVYIQLPENRTIQQLLREADIPRGAIDIRRANLPPWGDLTDVLPSLLVFPGLIWLLIILIYIKKKQQTSIHESSTK